MLLAIRHSFREGH